VISFKAEDFGRNHHNRGENWSLGCNRRSDGTTCRPATDMDSSTRNRKGHLARPCDATPPSSCTKNISPSEESSNLYYILDNYYLDKSEYDSDMFKKSWKDDF
jgi:hypothetical protein